MQDESDDAAEDDYPEETITITHGEDGTEIVIEDPTLLEIGALIVIALAAIALVHAVWSRGRHRNYRL